LASEPVELSVVLVNDAAIAELNFQYLNRTGPTNVLAFPMGEGPYPEGQARLLGDVVVSVETALREAADAEESPQSRLLDLLIHGILHLFGFDHELGEEEELRMERKSRELKERVSNLPG